MFELLKKYIMFLFLKILFNKRKYFLVVLKFVCKNGCLNLYILTTFKCLTCLIRVFLENSGYNVHNMVKYTLFFTFLKLLSNKEECFI
jgi:hypothetical protein